MPKPLDLRVFTAPLILFGAIAMVVGLGAAGIEATTDVGFENALGIAGTGATSFVAGAALALAGRRARPAEQADRVHIPATPRTRRTRGVVGVLASLIIVLLIAGALGGSGFGGTAEPAASPEPALEPAAATGPVLAESESFSGTLQGAALPLVGGAGAATATHALKLPDGVAAYHEELTWTPGPGGATTLSLTLEAEVDGAWQQVATATGGSPLALDAEELPADATAFRTTVALPANSGSTPVSYDLVVDSYTA